MPSGVVALAAAEEQGKGRKHRQRAGDGRRHRHDEGVPVSDMGEFVGHDSRHFLMVNAAQQAGGGRDGGVLGVSSRCEGVRLVVVDDIDARHGQPGVGRELLDDAVEARRAAPINFARAVHPEHQLVGVPVGIEIHAAGQDEREDHPAFAGDQKSSTYEQGR